MKKLYIFGELDPGCWESWVYWGTDKGCRSWLRKQGVVAGEVDQWMIAAKVFVPDTTPLTDRH